MMASPHNNFPQQADRSTTNYLAMLTDRETASKQ